MSSTGPHVIVLGGPNGAGKSTAAPALLPGALAITEFVNADTVAQGLSGFEPQRAAIQAGRVMLTRLRDLANQRLNFAFEITMASRTFAPWLGELIERGYALHLIYLWLPTPELAISRVTQRERLGGHHVPPEIVRRRYHAGLRNFFGLYRPLSATWRFFDASPPTGPRLVASGRGIRAEVVADPATWSQITGGESA